MQLVNTYLFNYRTNFNSFFRTERLSKLLILLFVLVTGLVVTFLVFSELRDKFWKQIFKSFLPFEITWYIKKFFNSFWTTNFSTKAIRGIFFNSKTYVFGAFFLFILESIRLFTKYKRATKKWNRFSLSYGVYENQKFLKTKKELIRTLGNVFAFGITLLIYSGCIFVFKRNYRFIGNFIFKRIGLFLFIWLTLTLFYSFNIKKRINRYYKNYYKKKDVNKKVDYLVITKSLFWHLLLNLFGCFMVVLNTPIDLFIIFMVLKFIPWNNIFSKLKIFNREITLLNLSY